MQSFTFVKMILSSWFQKRVVLFYMIVLLPLMVFAKKPANTLQFDKTQLLFEGTVSLATPNQTINLSTDDGTEPSITLSVLPAAAWLVLPANPVGVGDLTIGVNITNLRPGRYTTVVTASSGGYASAQFTVILDVGVKMNFQKPLSTDPSQGGTVSRDGEVPPSGWIRDSGLGYGPRNLANQGSGLTYGWLTGVANQNNLGTPLTINANGQFYQTLTNVGPLCANLDYTYRSGILMRINPLASTTARAWDIEVNNGVYEVTVTVGNANANASHNLFVEGVEAVPLFTPAGTPNACDLTRFQTVTVIVNVTDNRLRLWPGAAISPGTWINRAIVKPANLTLSFTPNPIIASKNFEDVPSTTTANINVKSNCLNCALPTLTLAKSGTADWLSIPANATPAPVTANNATFIATFDSFVAGNFLPVGVNQGNIVVSATGYPDLVVPIQFNILERSMSFTPTSFSRTTNYNVALASESATLNVPIGSPVVTLSKTAGADWLILPDPVILNNPMTFAYDVTGLPPGVHQATVTATADGYVNATLNFTVTVNAFGLSFNPSTPINVSAIQGDAIASQNVNLVAASGTPTILLTKTNNTASWLTIPASTLPGTITLAFDAGGLAPGIYETNILASTAGYTSVQLPVRLTINPKIAWNDPSWTIKINFQDDNVLTPPSGYLRDNGLSYAARNGQTYGWINPNTNSPTNNTTNNSNGTGVADLDKILGSFNLLQHPIFGAFDWEIALPNGQYNVLLSVGDPLLLDGVHRVNVEDINVIDNFQASTNDRNRYALASVNVTDGRLTLDANEGGRETKINFINIAPVGVDNIKPVISVKFNGTTTAPQSTIYKDQVLVDIKALDAGGSGLSLVEFSLNGGTFQPYTNALLINEVGDYTIRARATDGATNQSTTPIASFSVIRSVRTNGQIAVFNLDRFPADDQLTFSRIQSTAPPINGGPIPAGHEEVSIRIRNAGTANLRIDSFVLSNSTTWQITKLTGATYNPATQLPLNLTPGQFVDLTLRFVATYATNDGPPGGRKTCSQTVQINIGVLHETLTIISNDDETPQKTLFLHGLWQRVAEGCNEPNLNEIFESFAFKTVTGFSPDNDGSVANPQPKGDEVFSPNFVVADPTKPVYVRQISAFHSCCVGGASIYYNKPGQKGGLQIVRQIPADGQTLLPRGNLNLGTPAEKYFIPVASNTSPTGAFNFTIVDDNTDASLNLNGWVGVRIYKVRDVSGNIVPFAYLMTMDYLSGTSNFDYNDNTYYVENIRPENGTAYSSVLGSNVSEILYSNTQVQANNSVNLTVTNLGQNYPPSGPDDPKITISKIEIVGDDFEDFDAQLPLNRTLNPGTSVVIPVSFSPKSVGVKNAQLLIYYNIGNAILNDYSPKRIPLFGIAESSCETLAFTKRIKSAATSTASVIIGGDTWESDIPFRKGSVKLDDTDDLTSPINNTDRDALYRSYLSSTRDLRGYRYDIPLTNGNYIVRIHFAEKNFTTVGSRINNILFENEVKIPALDILAEAGYWTALAKEVEVEVKDGLLNIEVLPTANRPAISGVEIFRIDTNPSVFTLNQISLTNATCADANGSITVQASGGTATSFSYKLGKFGIYQASNTFSSLKAGDYTIYAKDDAGNCEISKVFTIGQDFPIPALDFTLDLTPVSCNDTDDGRAKIEITGGTAPYTIIWNDNPNLTTPTISTLPESVAHKVTVTDAVGCSKTLFFAIGKEPGCPIRINSGGPNIILSDGRSFQADQFFGSGSVYTNTSFTVTGTSDPALYNTERFTKKFAYNIPVPNGTYAVVLYFAEIREDIEAGEREFNVDIEGVRVISNYDLVERVGAFKADVRTFNTSVNDNGLNINLTNVIGDSKISAIEIIPINVTNVQPIAGTIPDQIVPLNIPFSFSFNANVFTDPGDILTYTATLADNSPLPLWINFNPATRTFSTFPTTPDVNVDDFIDVKVTATDSYGFPASETFRVTAKIADVLSGVDVLQNERPILAGTKRRQIIGVELDAGTAALTVSELTFAATGTNDISLIENAKLYFTGNNNNFAPINQFGSTVTDVSGVFAFTGNRVLNTGINYFWLVYDIVDNVDLGEVFDGECLSVTADAQVYTPSNTAPDGNREIGVLDLTPGNAGDIQGTNNRFQVNANIEIPAQFTLEFWLNPRQNATSDKWVIGENNGMRIIQNGNTLQFYVVDNSGTLRGPATANLVTNLNSSIDQWNHVAATFDASNLRLYINGREGTPAVFSGSNADRNGDFFIGGTTSTDQNNFQIDEIRFWNVARTVSQIRLNMNLVTKNLEPNLINYWQFNESTNSLEGKDLVGDNYLQRSNSTLTNWVEASDPVGDGVANLQTVTTGSLVNFTNTGVQVLFGANNPNGEVVVTRLQNVLPFEGDNLNITEIPPSIYDGRDLSSNYWIINNFGNTANLTPMEVTFTIDETLFNSATQANKFILHKRPTGSTGRWLNDYFGAQIGGALGNRFVKFGGITGFSQNVISANGAPLPVQLLSFMGERLDETAVELKWVTITEINNKGFEVQKSSDAKNFTTIGFVDGRGTTNQMQSYSFVDNNAEEASYYRLKQIDLGNENIFNYSPIIFIKGDKDNDLSIYPNPAQSMISFERSGIWRKSTNINLSLTNTLGDIIFQTNGNFSKVEEDINKYLSQLSAGMYLVKVIDGTQIKTLKLIKQ
jgi:hypothetical protein